MKKKYTDEKLRYAQKMKNNFAKKVMNSNYNANDIFVLGDTLKEALSNLNMFQFWQKMENYYKECI